MALTFPANPTNGQIYDQYVYDATAQTWRVYGSDTGITNVLATKANLSGGNTFSGNQIFNNYVTKPLNPAFNVRVSSNYTTTTGSPDIIFGTTIYNIGNHFNTSNGRFTAPISGIYSFTSMVRAEVNQIYWHSWFKINGVNLLNGLGHGLYGLVSTSNTTGFNAGEATAVLSLNAGDYVTSAYWSTSAVTIQQQTFFQGHLVG